MLELYRTKIESFEAEEQRWMDRLASSRGMIKKVLHLEHSLEEKDREIKALQSAVVEMQTAINQERKRALKLQGENDKLRIRDSENRRKILVLLEICGKGEFELTRMIAEADKEDEGSKSDIYVPDNLKQFIRESKVPQT